MKRFFEHKTAVCLIVATVIVAVLIGIFAATSNNDKASAAENIVGTATEPGKAAATGAGGWFKGIFQYFGSIKSLRAENEELKRVNIELDKQVRDAQGLEKENYQLRKMLDLMETESKLDLIATKVIAKDPSNWYSSFTINKGTNDGIQKNQPVLTANKELIGQVYRVGSGWAEIITVLDPESGVGCMVERSKDIGVLEGDSALRYKGLCKLGYLSRDADIEIGDYVETSGMGGIYPKGLLVGRVTEIKEDNATMSKYASVEPVVDIGKLTEVFVLKNFVDEIKREPIESGLNDDDKKDDKDDKNTTKDDDLDENEDKSKPTETTKATSKPTSKPTTKPTSKPATEATSKPTTKPTSKPASAGSSTNSSSSNSSGSSNTGSSANSSEMNGTELRD